MLVEVDDDEVTDIIVQLDVEVMVEVVTVKVETDETDETVIVQPEVMVECEVIWIAVEQICSQVTEVIEVIVYTETEVIDEWLVIEIIVMHVMLISNLETEVIVYTEPEVIEVIEVQVCVIQTPLVFILDTLVSLEMDDVAYSETEVSDETDDVLVGLGTYDVEPTDDVVEILGMELDETEVYDDIIIIKPETMIVETDELDEMHCDDFTPCL